MDRLVVFVSIMIPMKTLIEYRLERNMSIMSIKGTLNFRDI
jgi:hypothetical protein